MAKRKRNQPRRRRRVPTASQLFWEHNHAAQSSLRNTIRKYRRHQARTDEAKSELRKVIAESYKLGATPERIANEMGISPQAVRKSWLPPNPNTSSKEPPIA